MSEIFKKSRVLLIEKDPDIKKIISDYFDDLVTITYADSEPDITNYIKHGAWDLIITDIRLPDMNDLHVTQLAKEADPHTSVLIITENQKIDFILEALQHHADGLEFKPLEKSKFLDVAFKLITASQYKHSRNYKKIILAIGAHPDDVEIGCGGTLALHRSHGDVLNILTLSLGNVGGDPGTRRVEAQRAADLQGAHLFLKNLNDTKISEGVETIQLIEEAIDVIKPTHIYTHSIYDIHQDHRNVYLATLSASRQVPNLYCYQSPSSSVYFKPNLFIEISGEFLQKKLDAIACFKSQCEIRPYLKEDMLRANARYWGRFTNYGFAEPLEVTRQNLISES